MRIWTVCYSKLTLFVGISLFSGLFPAIAEQTASEILIDGAGISFNAAEHIESQFEARKKKYNVTEEDYFEAQQQIWEESGGGPVLDSLGLSAMALVKNQWAQALHIIVTLIALILAFTGAAHPSNANGISSQGADLGKNAIVSLLYKAVIGIIIMAYPSMIYSTVITLKDSTTLIASFIVNAEDKDTGKSSSRIKERLELMGDEQIATYLSQQKAIHTAVKDRFRAFVNDAPRYLNGNPVGSQAGSTSPNLTSVIEDYSLTYLSELGSVYNAQKTIGADAFSGPLDLAENTSREEAVKLLREYLADTLLVMSTAPKNGTYTLNLPTEYFSDEGPSGKTYYRGKYQQVDANFRARMNDAYEYRDKIISEYRKNKEGSTAFSLNPFSSTKRVVETNTNDAKDLRESLMTEYYSRVYTTTVEFLDQSLGGYLKQTPHSGHVSQRLTELGSAKANLELPEEKTNIALDTLLTARNFIQKLVIFVGYTLFEGVIEISLVILWMAYPLWFHPATAKAFTGRASNMLRLSAITAVFVFLISVVEVMCAQILHLALGSGIKESLGGGLTGGVVQNLVFGAAVGSGAIYTGVIAGYIVSVILCLWMSPKITKSIFTGGAIVGTLAQGVATSIAAGTLASASTLTTGGPLAAGAMGRFGRGAVERKAMGGPGTGAGIIANPFRTSTTARSKGNVTASVQGRNTDSNRASPASRTTRRSSSGGSKLNPHTPNGAFVAGRELGRQATIVGREASSALASGGDLRSYMATRRNAVSPGSAEEDDTLG